MASKGREPSGRVWKSGILCFWYTGWWWDILVGCLEIDIRLSGVVKLYMRCSGKNSTDTCLDNTTIAFRNRLATTMRNIELSHVW